MAHAFDKPTAFAPPPCARIVWRWIAGVAMLGTIGVAQDAASGELRLRTQARGDALVVEASATLSSDLGTAWRILTDYAHYDRIVPRVRSIRIVERRGAQVTVEQSGDAGAWLFFTPIDLTYEITEDAPVRLQSRITSGCACSFESTYTLTPSGSGTRLDYVGTLVAASDLRGIVQRYAMEKSLTHHLQAVADEIEHAALSVPIQGLARMEPDAQQPDDRLSHPAPNR
jgi:hypothetical protein